jgi:hypothetical protein
MLFASAGEIGNPSAAYAMAGAASSANGRVPNRSRSAKHPSTNPGTEGESGPRCAITRRPSGASWPCSRMNSSDAPRGAMPLPWKARRSPLLPPEESGLATMAKRSPPIPQRPGMTTVPTSAAATAASTALPPVASTRSPADETRGCCAPMMPSRAITGLIRRVSQLAAFTGSNAPGNPRVIAFLHNARFSGRRS